MFPSLSYERKARVFSLFLLISGMIVVAGVFLPIWTAASANVARYKFPENIELSIVPQGVWNLSSGAVVKAKITSRLGTLRDLEVFFEASPDLTVSPAKGKFDKLAEGESETMLLRVGKGPGLPDEMGSWVRMRVRYLPDYERILQKVQDVAVYPNAYERQRLIDVAERNKKGSERYTAAFRFFAR